jgi:hypothetical protein
MVIGGRRAGNGLSAPAGCLYETFRLFWHHFVEDVPGGIMFEDQTVDLLPARTTLQAGAGGNGGNGGRGGDAVAISAAAIFVQGNVDDSTLTVSPVPPRRPVATVAPVAPVAPVATTDRSFRRHRTDVTLSMTACR